MLKNLSKIYKNQKGDTIIEVIIAVAIVSLVLTGAFAISNRSSKSIRMSQERATGTKYAQSMIERLYADPSLYASAGPKFCADGSDPGVAPKPPACREASVGVEYYTVVTRISQNPDTYQVKTFWDGLDGTEQKVEFLYRLAI